MKRVVAAISMTVPGAAAACALPPSVILTLPVGHYIVGAATVVAVTGLTGAMARRLPAARVIEFGGGGPKIAGVTTYLAFAAFLALVGVGWLGPRDPMHNLMTLVFWTGVWIAVPLASMLVGNLWHLINPWTAPVRIARALLGRSGAAGLARYGMWPAVIGLAGFLWFQIVSLSPDDPAVLATAALTYWTVIFGLAVAEGEDWLDRGEFLTVLFAMLARVSPLWCDGRWHLGWPGSQILTMPALSRAGVAFVTLALAGLTFDGLSETFWWLAVIGENPLEFTGRSAVQGVNTAGLLAVWGLTAAGLLAMIRAGGLASGPVMLSFLAIAAGYHAAHYLVMLLTAGQYTLAALNDPLFRGDMLLGIEPFYVSFGFLADRTVVQVIYGAQFAAILGAHLLAVVLALKLAGPARPWAHLPLTGAMVGYTVLGLWLLSTARGI